MRCQSMFIFRWHASKGGSIGWLAAHALAQPGPAEAPAPPDRADAGAECSRGLRHRQPTEEPQLHDLRVIRALLLEPCERLLHGEHFGVAVLSDHETGER